MSDATRWTWRPWHGSTLVAILAALAMTAIGCAHVHHHQKPSSHARAREAGPPPHAPAHGYRHKHRNVELVFDADIDVYVVVGHPNHYHDGERYYRRTGGRWQMSTSLDGVWITASMREVPPGLHGKRAKSKPKRGHGPPAKHGY